MRIRTLRRLAVGTLLAGLAFAGMLALAGWIVCPDMSQTSAVPDGDELRRVEGFRGLTLDPANPPRLHREVDYSEGRSASWYPKGESPILAELVREGELPPVEERVGEEPIVVEGVDGIGKYGGTWFRLANADPDVDLVRTRLSASTLVRWSPQGYPIVPHLAISYEVSPDSREFTFVLRKGVKWSDGHPLTTEDILYWWENEINDETVSGTVPTYMTVNGKPATVTRIDDYRVRIAFPEPNGIFLANMAGPPGQDLLRSPAHYLRPYHPTLGDDDLIRERMRVLRADDPLDVYRGLKAVRNPEHPRLWPWLFRTHKMNPPYTFERNPYYYVVDIEGNQLPYVDRLLFDVARPDILPIKAAMGEVTMQFRSILYNEYTYLMDQRAKGDYEVYHWYAGDRSDYLISPNINLKVIPDRPDTAKKHELLNDKRFRQALSLAIDRAQIIRAEYSGQAEPAQLSPGRASPFFEPALHAKFAQHDPERARQLLDEIGLTRRDYEGYRTFRDGARMTFFLSHSQATGAGPAEFLVEDWAAVGIRVISRERARTLFYTQKAAREHDLNVWTGNGEFVPLMDPRHYVPVNYIESNFALGFAKWYARGGLHGNPLAYGPGCIEPPAGHPARRAMELYEASCAYADLADQVDAFREVLDIAAENVWTINICTPPPVLVVVKNDFRNVPRLAVSTWSFLTPGNAGVETYYFEDPYDSPGAIRQIKHAIMHPTLPPLVAAAQAERDPSARRGFAPGIATILRWAVVCVVVIGLVLISVKYAYIRRRILLMAPTLFIISVISFIIIQLPPGDFVTARIMQLQESGDAVDVKILEDLRESFWLDDPMVVRYMRWLGLYWFVTFEPEDRGLLQGDMGLSMAMGGEVNSVVGDRITLTFLISLGTTIFIWATAIPIGIYSAVRQYSVGDYVLTFVGFIGMCVPSFLLALVLMHVSAEYFGIRVSGLFSAHYGAQPEWTWGKVLDLFQHIWLPVLVMGVGGTAGMIRVMRANLLDELKKPYVVAARARGVRPLRLLFRYPVRLAMNPFVSGIGGILPGLFSGGAIVAVVLSLPTVGPLMLTALMVEDLYMAGSMLMVLSLLSVTGVLLSDLLLLWVDPRIRFQGGTR